MAVVANYGGMGSSKVVTAKDIMKLPFIDSDIKIKPIKNRYQALKLLKSFLS